MNIYTYTCITAEFSRYTQLEEELYFLQSVLCYALVELNKSHLFPSWIFHEYFTGNCQVPSQLEDYPACHLLPSKTHRNCWFWRHKWVKITPTTLYPVRDTEAFPSVERLWKTPGLHKTFKKYVIIVKKPTLSPPWFCWLPLISGITTIYFRMLL